MNLRSLQWIVIVLLGMGILLACRTTDLIRSVNLGAARAAPTHAADAPSNAASPEASATHDPNAGFEFVPDGTPHCGAGDNRASVVKGRIVSNGAPVAGQRVTASAGPGGEPISDEPAVSDDRGNYQVTFVCDGKACDGAFWVWTVDEASNQTSPFVEFIFDNQCRSGTLNFRHR
jgi:hypothetical protein